MRHLAYCLLLVACSDPMMASEGVDVGGAASATGASTTEPVSVGGSSFTATGGQSAATTTVVKATGGAKQMATSSTGGATMKVSAPTTTLVATGGGAQTGGASSTGGSSAATLGGSPATGGSHSLPSCVPDWESVATEGSGPELVYDNGMCSVLCGKDSCKASGLSYSISPYRYIPDSEIMKSQGTVPAGPYEVIRVVLRDLSKMWCRQNNKYEGDITIPGINEIHQDYWLVRETGLDSAGACDTAVFSYLNKLIPLAQ